MLLLEMLEDYSGMNKLFEKVYVYANQRLHQDRGMPQARIRGFYGGIDG